MAPRSMMSRVEACLTNIASHNKRINAFVSLRLADEIRAESSSISRNHGVRKGPLSGRAIGIKDNFCTLDLPTTCASNILQGYTSPYEATSVSLLKQAGGIMIGKTNMDEFAMGSTNEHSWYGPALNPLFPDTDVTPGGSSGGSAAAVAADMCEVALGSDTGGSVRLPSAYCGVIGFKPSYGLISRYGVVSYAQSLDTVGIISKDIDLVETTFNVLNKYDENDPTSIRPEIRHQIAGLPKKPATLNIGIIEEAIIDLSPEVREAWVSCIEYLRSLGHNITTVSLPTLKSSLPTYFIVSLAEASSNLARYDGVRYGTRAAKDRDESGSLYAPTRTEGFGPEVQRRILLGTYNLSARAYGNHFEKAQRVRHKFLMELNSVFAMPNVLYDEVSNGTIDVFVHPTARTPAPSFADIRKSKSAIDSYVNDALTVPANHAGLPAISIPWGNVPSVGMQVWGQFGDDHTVLNVARMLLNR
jgi:aspartyl-tRNA(Asn)/glutamyl-tRNA(Gln) amidotransferase subunit A